MTLVTQRPTPHLVTVREEERFLEATFGADYRAYARAVPRFLPSLRPYGPIRPPAPLAITPRLVLRGILEAGVVMFVIPLADFVEYLHTSGALPVLLRV